MRYVLSVFTFLWFSSLGFGQFNLSVSYNIGLTQPTVLDGIVDRYNSSRPFLQNTLDRTKVLNGYGIGLRYKIDRIAFDARWENLIDGSEASGVDPSNNDNDFEQLLFLRLSTYAFGIESFFSDKFSIHASFEFNKVRYRTEINDSGDRFDLLNDWGTGSTFSIGYNFIGGGLIHVSLRPYMHVSWTGHDLAKLDQTLNPDTFSNENLNEEFFNFGLKLIFYNGSW